LGRRDRPRIGKQHGQRMAQCHTLPSLLRRPGAAGCTTEGIEHCRNGYEFLTSACPVPSSSAGEDRKRLMGWAPCCAVQVHPRLACGFPGGVELIGDVGPSAEVHLVGRVAPSTHHSSQSIRPRSSSLNCNASMIAANTPVRRHSEKYRCTVLPEPKRSGRSHG
jgi:hypothetical protein